ncbi:hypothetical protein B5P45_13550 [Phyllobacterium zundukense]|uniref:Uncharacterized protein n=1 Tax=Phyllobacterium zundukense TaxID=1867719 RepID=A0A2N9VXS2_9HYPH|nr:hypothetical protein BLM14_28770 [Phyllobacterium zundukense]PIO44290.1 hypothetical protein B5P45_13550 [Phyllobacterium zundukense]
MRPGEGLSAGKAHQQQWHQKTKGYPLEASQFRWAISVLARLIDLKQLHADDAPACGEIHRL